MTIGMQNKLQNKNRKKGCPIDRRTIENKHMYKINMIYCIYIYDPNFRIELNYFG